MVCGRLNAFRLAPFLFRLCLLSNSDTTIRYTKTYRHRSGSFKYVFIIHLYFSPEASSWQTIRTKQMKYIDVIVQYFVDAYLNKGALLT